VLTPRKDEVAAVVALLEGEEHETAEELAKAILKEVSGLLSKRDSYGVAIGLRTDDLRIPHGPFWTLLDAKRTQREAEARGLVSFIAPLRAATDALREEEIAHSKRCVCGHPKELHGLSITPRAVTSLGCCVYKRREKCACATYSAA
jgi:hypothetical protein